MPANVAVPYFKPGKDVTGTAKVAVKGKRFVAVVPGGRPLAPMIGAAVKAAMPFGVAGHDIAKDGFVHVLREGIVPVVASADLTAGTRVEVGADGSVVPFSTGIPVGTCVANAASGADAAIALSL